MKNMLYVDYIIVIKMFSIYIIRFIYRKIYIYNVYVEDYYKIKKKF